MTDSTLSIMSRARAAAVYFVWFSLPLAIYWRYIISPPARGEEADAFTFAIGMVGIQPVLAALFWALFLRGEFQSGHGQWAITLNASFSAAGIAAVIAGLVLALLLLPFAFVIMLVLVSQVLPAIFFSWFALIVVSAVAAAQGIEATRISSQLRGIISGASRRSDEERPLLPSEGEHPPLGKQ